MNMRELRLQHWLDCLKWRVEANAFRAEGLHHFARLHDEIANAHLQMVQILNDSFPIDDTAEQDAAKKNIA